MAAAFLVDGHTEQRFIERICRGKVVQRLNLNGRSVEAAAIAKRAATQVRLWKGRYYPIVILVDLEDRSTGWAAFRRQIINALVDEGLPDQIIVGVADRMIENWILADADLVGWANCPESVDGLHGCNVLRRYVDGYDKATNGPSLLEKCRPSRMRGRSSSFASFAEALAGLRCAWLTR